MSATLPSATTRRVHRFAEAASVLADEACLLAVANLPPGHDADVARRAAGQARDAVDAIGRLDATGAATLDAVMEAAAWAMTSAAVAIAQGNLALGARRIKVDEPARAGEGRAAAPSAPASPRSAQDAP